MIPTIGLKTSPDLRQFRGSGLKRDAHAKCTTIRSFVRLLTAWKTAKKEHSQVSSTATGIGVAKRGVFDSEG